MFKKLHVLVAFVFIHTASFAQEHGVRIVEEKAPNRLNLYAYNESEKDYDVAIVVTGTNFRQKSPSKPRFARVPATSKVLLHTLILLRDKKPSYTYELMVNDSLSRRSLQKEFELIKIPPARPIILYTTENCFNCDSLVASLNESPFMFTEQNLVEKPEIWEQLSPYFVGSKSVTDSIQNPLINLGGVLHSDIENYEQLREVLEKYKAEK